MEWVVYVALICGALGVAYSLLTAGWVFKQDAGNQRMQEISSYVAEGAMAYLTRQYKVVAMIAVILVIILYVDIGPDAGHRVHRRSRRLRSCRLPGDESFYKGQCAGGRRRGQEPS